MSTKHLTFDEFSRKHILDIITNSEYTTPKMVMLRMIDAVSLQILKILQEKARIPNVEVARRIGMAPSAVLERIRKLEKQGYIDGYEVRLNPQRFRRGLVGFIHLVMDAGADETSLVTRLSSIEDIQEIHYIAGEDGYLIKVRVAGTEELDRLVRERIRSIAGVCSTRTSVALATIKETTRITIDGQPAKKR